MNSKIRLLGLAVLAVCAFTAANTGSAPAAFFHCSVGPCIATTSQHEGLEKLTIGSLSVQCKLNTGRSTAVTKTYAATTLALTFAECESSVGSATWKPNHCDTKIVSDTTGEHAPITINCSGTSENQMEIATGGCTIKLGEQTPKGGVHFTNVQTGGFKEITSHTTVSSIAYTKSGVTCGFITGEASITGTKTEKCYEDKGTSHPSGTEGTTPPATTEGAQVDCFWE